MVTMKDTRRAKDASDLSNEILICITNAKAKIDPGADDADRAQAFDGICAAITTKLEAATPAIARYADDVRTGYKASLGFSRAVSAAIEKYLDWTRLDGDEAALSVIGAAKILSIWEHDVDDDVAMALGLTIETVAAWSAYVTKPTWAI